MRVDMQNFKSDKRYAKYSTFKIGDAGCKYKLTVGGFSGNAGRFNQIQRIKLLASPLQVRST